MHRKLQNGEAFMSAEIELCPAEVLGLMHLGQDRSVDAIKITIISFIVQGLMKIEENIQKGFANIKRRSVLLKLTENTPAAISGPDGAVLETLAPIGTTGEAMPKVVSRLKKQFGSTLSSFNSQHIVPSLMNRGLIEARREKLMWIIPVTRYRTTSSGEIERNRLLGLVQKAKEILKYLDNDPAQAAALVSTLGVSILAVEEIRPYIAQLSSLMRAYQGVDDFSDSTDFGSVFSLENFDYSALDTLSADLAVLDASFDNSADSSGGDSSSGDTGGGGGD